MNLRKLIPLLLVPALGGLFYTFQRMEGGGVQTLAASTSLPRYVVDDATLQRFDDEGALQVHGHADSVEYFDDASARAHQLQIDLIDDGDVTWTATAPASTLPAHQHRFMLEGPVVADGTWPDSGEPVELHTDRLWVDPDRHELQTDAAVNWNGPTRSGSAVGMRGDWSQNHLVLLHDVRMRYESLAH